MTPRPARVALLVRLTVLLSGAVLFLVPPQLPTVPAGIMGLGVALAVAAPGRIGAGIAMAGFVLTWTSAYGWHAVPPAPRTIAAAAALYALHATSSLAAFVPLGAEVDTAVLRRYALRCGPIVCGAAVIITISYAIPRFAGSALVELAGLIGVLVVAAIPAWLVLRDRATS